jgi:SecD/SecF fusion protein
VSDYFDRIERQIVRSIEAGPPRSSRLPVTFGHLATAAAVAVVIVVAGTFLLLRGGGGAKPAPATAPALRVVFSASPAAPAAVVERSAQILRERLYAAVPDAQVSVAGDQIVVTAAHAPAGAATQILRLAARGQLDFYDWEGDVIASDGKTVASQLPSPSPAVLAISQGSGSAAPGQLGAGCMSPQEAVALAAKLGAGTPRRTEYVDGVRFRVPIGYTVLKAADFGPRTSSDGYFVVRERPAISNHAIVSPRANRDPNTRAPGVEFRFTVAGDAKFQALTKRIAERGSLLSSPGQMLNQHFAVALDNRILTVPYIDFQQYPDGISGNTSVQLTPGLSTQSAKDLAILLRYGPLPVSLTATG